MLLTVGREDFLRILTRTQGVVDRRHSVAILTNLVMEADGDGLTVIATDLEVSLKQRCPAEVKDGGTVAVSARKLFEIVRESTADEVTVESLDNFGIRVVYGRSRFQLVGIDPVEHPGMPKDVADTASIPKAEIDAGELGGMISRTIFAVSSDDTRSNLSGIHITGTDEGKTLRMVATDGHRLAMIDRELMSGTIDSGVILPRKGLSEVAKMLAEQTGSVHLGLTEKEAVVDLAGCIFSMRLVEGNFPDYQQVIPKESPNVAAVDRETLFQTVRRVALMSPERAHGVRLSLSENHLVLSASNPDLGDASEEVEIEYAGKTLDIGFNAHYLIDVLNAIPEGERVELGFGDELSPGLLRGEDSGYTCVVMPMRI